MKIENGYVVIEKEDRAGYLISVRYLSNSKYEIRLCSEKDVFIQTDNLNVVSMRFNRDLVTIVLKSSSEYIKSF